MPKSRKRKRKPFLKPVRLPDGAQAGDLVAIDKKGNVFPLGPELLGDEWPTIRAKFADIDRRRILTLEEIRCTDDTEN
jgi:hypothetical protein